MTLDRIIQEFILLLILLFVFVAPVAVLAPTLARLVERLIVQVPVFGAVLVDRLARAVLVVTALVVVAAAVVAVARSPVAEAVRVLDNHTWAPARTAALCTALAVAFVAAVVAPAALAAPAAGYIHSSVVAILGATLATDLPST